MPTGPKGQKRSADTIGNAVHVMKVLTGEADRRIAPTFLGFEDVLARIDAASPPAKARGPYKKRDRAGLGA